MVSSTINIDKFFIVRVHGYIPKTTPTIAVTYVTFYVKADKPAHANLLCIGITDGYKTISISRVVDNEFIRKHRDLMVNSNLNAFKFGIYFIFDDVKNNVILEWKDGEPILKLYKKIYLFIEPFDPATLDKLQEEKNDQEAINYFYTKFDGKCSKLKWGKDENGAEVLWLVYNREGKAKELDFKEENGEITILGLKQQEGEGK